jgi:hypothetical protein
VIPENCAVQQFAWLPCRREIFSRRGAFFAEALKLFCKRNVAVWLALASIFLADLANFGPRPRVARFFCLFLAETGDRCRRSMGQIA